MTDSPTSTTTSWVRWRSVQVRTGIFVALAAAAGLSLDLAIIGSAPERAAESAEVLAAPEPAIAPVREPTTVDLVVPAPTDPTVDPAIATVPPRPDATAPVVAPAPSAPAAPAAVPAVPVVPAAAPVAAPVVVPVAPAPVTAATTAPRAPAPATVTAAPTAPATPTALSPTPTPTPTPVPVAPTTPPTTATPTAPPTTAAPTAPTTTAAPTGEQLTYEVASIGGQVVIDFVDRSSLSLVAVRPGSGWVYAVEQNGPRTVKLNFYNVNTGRDAEWKATVESGRIQIEN